MHDIDAMKAIEAEMLTANCGIVIHPADPRGQSYTLNGKPLNGQIVRDMVNSGWLLDLGNQFALAAQKSPPDTWNDGDPPWSDTALSLWP